MIIKQLVCLILLTITKLGFVRSDCYSYSNGHCGGVANQCSKNIFVKETETTCVRCSTWKGDACGKLGDLNICSKYERSTEQYCYLKCSVNTPSGCGEGHSRCSSYKQIDENTCIDCTQYINSKCGNSDICQEYLYDKKKNLCLLKCEQIQDDKCGGDATRCKLYRNVANSEKCVDCTLYSNGSCGGQGGATECSTYFIQDLSNRDKCVYRCEYYENYTCGGDFKRCYHYQQAGGGKCTNCLQYFEGRGCGQGDYGFCKEYFKVSPTACQINCTRLLDDKCGGERGQSNCWQYKKVGKNECNVDPDVVQNDSKDYSDNGADESFSTLITYSISILLVLISFM